MNNNRLAGNILIVDDTPENLRLLKELLNASGLKVRPANSGELALKSAFRTPPDLILLDIRMPGLDGYEVCRRLKAEPKTKDIPVIFISAMGELRDRIQGFELGAVDFISKPFEREEVMVRVRTHLELHQMRTSLEAMVADRTHQLADSVRALKTLSGVNQALVHASDEAGLFQRVCHIMHETGGFPMVWIGLLQNRGEGLRVMAQLGGEPALVERLAEAEANNPTTQTIATGTPTQCTDIVGSGAFGALTGELSAQGLNSAIAQPLSHKGDVIGAITLFSEQPGSMDGDALARLNELSEDLAFGILHLRTQAAQRVAEHERLAQAERLSQATQQTIQAVSQTVEKRDPYTAGHQHRVAELTVAIAREMGLAEDQVLGLHMSAMIHDLGKIYVPAEILSRPGKLSDAEWGIVRTHSQVGHDIIQGVDFPWPVAEIILQHHERLDGSGYPRGLKGEQILLEARIIAVADVVEAMASHRPYRPAVGLEAALAELRRGSGSHYDAAVVTACERLFQELGYQLPPF